LGYLDYAFGKARLNYPRKKEIVVLLNILPDDLSVGYFDVNHEVIKNVNGKEFVSFSDFVSLLENETGEFIRFETDFGQKIIIATDKIQDITKEILMRNNIPAQSGSGSLN